MDGSRAAPDPFWERVDTSAGPEECWLWMGRRLPRGYGRLYHGGRHTYAHRVSWELAHGPIPTGLHVCHHCDTPPCVNPAHLFLGTAADNVADRDAKGRRRTVLTAARAQDIRERYALGGITQTALARHYGVSHVTISKLISGRIWRGVAP